jgi:hypothetical protein
MRDYAKKYCMDFFEDADCKISPAIWTKLLLAKQKFLEGYEFVFWVDADAAIRRFDEDIRAEVDHEHDLYFVFEEGFRHLGPSPTRLNGGVFVWRNSPATFQFIDAVMAQREFMKHKWWDQSAMIAALGLWSHFDDEHHRPDRPTRFCKVLKRLPTKWNCLMGCDANPAAIIRHFIAMDPRGKLIALRIDELLDLGPRSQNTEEAFRQIVRQLWRLTLRRGLGAPQPMVNMRPQGRVGSSEASR